MTLQIDQLKIRHCRWGYECEQDGQLETRYCGCDRAPGSIWCEEHKKRATHKTTSPKKFIRSIRKYSIT